MGSIRSPLVVFLKLSGRSQFANSMLNAAGDLRDLRIPPANCLKALKGDWSGFHSIRVNDQFRVVFKWTEGNAKDVQITDYH
jgi:proteic killer suppression protein